VSNIMRALASNGEVKLTNLNLSGNNLLAQVSVHQTRARALLRGWVLASQACVCFIPEGGLGFCVSLFPGGALRTLTAGTVRASLTPPPCGLSKASIQTPSSHS
jgi:hypothetical protein